MYLRVMRYKYGAILEQTGNIHSTEYSQIFVHT